MLKDLISKNQEYSLIYLLLIIFFITEVIDDTLDHILGSSKLHSIIQLFFFMMLFYIITRIFLGYYKRRISKLIPEELMSILKIIKEAEVRGVVVNQREIRTKLNITKPTLKRRIDNLISLNYVSFEKEGNNKYLKITPLGNSILK